VTIQFQHVMVLTSIIIGLGITQILSGFSAAIERRTRQQAKERLGWASGCWLAYLFLWMAQFWWWEFRLLEVLKNWTLWNYFVVVSYSVVLYLLVAIIVPRDWNAVDDLDEYFLSRRRWFYSIFLLASLIDLLDSHMKGGWGFVRETGLLGWVQNVAIVPASLLGFRSANRRVHAALAILFLVWQVIVVFDVLPVLKF
jgi:hypothetical protein